MEILEVAVSAVGAVLAVVGARLAIWPPFFWVDLFVGLAFVAIGVTLIVAMSSVWP